MRSQSRPNLTRSPRRRRPENVCILSSLISRSKSLPSLEPRLPRAKDKSCYLGIVDTAGRKHIMRKRLQ